MYTCVADLFISLYAISSVNVLFVEPLLPPLYLMCRLKVVNSNTPLPPQLRNPSITSHVVKLASLFNLIVLC